MSHKYQHGYIAVVSSLILTALVLAIILTSASNVFFGLTNVLISKSKKTTKYLAESCLETALLSLANDKSYTGNETITIASSSCKIVSIVNQGATKIIKSSASSSYSSTNLILTVSSTTLQKVSLEEASAF